jgi:putative transposase
MPKGLRRFHNTGRWHFITCSCYRRQTFLGSARHRDVFVEILEKVLEQHDFVVAGYVVMPEHFHLLIRTGGPGFEVFSFRPSPHPGCPILCGERGF